ncbi:mitochondrial fission ELM1 family protein [Jiella sonneratiae]|uniref:Mitochondrial fission ELM1 family protein n=1 Tax=Jiella sonneratiae TaxID=2816856 RepID=A0ABS3J3B5_9HYPH|nr:mitochondrial fission ELM1 family protein [Jiella sonneratiae]MBO0904149.1 mitochondrial fission ELM1 family protein [Jiella sonneratiae]
MRAWTVCDPKAGTLTQSLGVARHFDPEPHRVLLDGRLAKWRKGPLSPYWRRTGAPEPEILVSCGSFATRHVAAIAAACRNRPFTVHLQPVDDGLGDRFDLVFAARHDLRAIPSPPANYREMLGAPHQLSRAMLEARRTAARARWAPSGGPVVAVLVGGPTKAYRYDDATLTRLQAAIEGFAKEGRTVLASPSRRTPPALFDWLLGVRSDRILVWDRSGENPYLDFVAAADAFLVTKDSVTMPSEAATTGRPVFVFDLAGIPGEKFDEFEWFHDDLSRTLGLTRPFEGRIYDYAYEPPDESRRIAAVIRNEMARRGDLRP